MLDSETKRRIDTARDILVGKVPDPKSQVEQITLALIYKFMDDMDAQAEELGGKRKFFANGKGGDFARYGWAKLMAPGVSGHELVGLYGEGIAKMPENPGIPTLFRDIFKNAYLPYRDPETLKSFLKVIDEFEYDHSERLGDAFEYLLSVLGSQGDAGQFRTPRHIIDFIVKIVDPKKNETILDPACGTAGFLISAWKHINKANAKDGHSGLTPDERKKLAAGITGYDISPDMVRLSRANMYLHGFADPHIYEYDTLTSLERWKETADVILANPPFMSPKGGIKPHDRFGVQSKRSEVLFVDYFIEHLTPNGKAGLIVPEGIHFVAHGGHERLRQILIDGGYLLADVTLPHGVFKPYASVKTHVLLIDRALARHRKSVLFVEIENDGFSQTDTREPVSGSQLDAAASCISSFKVGEVEEALSVASNFGLRAYEVQKEILRSTKTCHLLGRWHDLPNRVIHQEEIPLMRLGDLCDICDGRSPNMATTPGEFVMVVPAEERKTADHWDFEGPAICVPLISSSGHGKADIKRIHYQEGRFALANTMCAIKVRDTALLRPRYLFVFLSATSRELLVPLMCGATNVTMNSEQLADVLIPVPRPTEQDIIVESHIIATNAKKMRLLALDLCQSTSDPRVRDFANRIVEEIDDLTRSSSDRLTVESFIPSRRESSGPSCRN